MASSSSIFDSGESFEGVLVALLILKILTCLLIILINWLYFNGQNCETYHFTSKYLENIVVGFFTCFVFKGCGPFY